MIQRGGPRGARALGAVLAIGLTATGTAAAQVDHSADQTRARVASAEVRLAPPGTTFRLGEGPYAVPITVSKATRLSQFAGLWSYDAALRRVDGVRESIFMRMGGVDATFSPRTVPGRVGIAVSRDDADVAGASGSGIIAIVTFDPIAAGSATLVLTGVGAGPKGATQALRFSTATIHVEPAESSPTPDTVLTSQDISSLPAAAPKAKPLLAVVPEVVWAGKPVSPAPCAEVRAARPATPVTSTEQPLPRLTTPAADAMPRQVVATTRPPSWSSPEIERVAASPSVSQPPPSSAPLPIIIRGGVTATPPPNAWSPSPATTPAVDAPLNVATPASVTEAASGSTPPRIVSTPSDVEALPRVTSPSALTATPPSSVAAWAGAAAGPDIGQTPAAKPASQAPPPAAGQKPPAAAAVQTEPADASALELATALQRRYDGIKDFSADFVHSYRGGTLRKVITERGRLFVKKAGKMRWEYVSPEEKLFVSDGLKMYSYIPQDKQVLVRSVPKTEQVSTPTMFLAGTGNLVRDFTFTIVDAPAGSAPGTRALKLVPKVVQAEYDWMILAVAPKTMELRGMVTEDAQGGQSSFSFTNLKENPGLADKQFTFKIPRGVDVVTDSPSR